MEQFLIELMNAQGMIAIFAALLVGVLTSLAPCSILTLPLLVSSALQMNQDLPIHQRQHFTYWFSILFVIGLIISLTLLGWLAVQVGYLFSFAPREAYLLAAIITLLLGLQGFAVLPTFNKTGVLKTLIRWRLGGALLIGMVFGLVSTPCATPPLGAMMVIAADSSLLYAFVLMLAFAIGHGSLLLATGLSLGVAERILAHRALGRLSTIISKLFAIILLILAIYFGIRAFQHPWLWI